DGETRCAIMRLRRFREHLKRCRSFAFKARSFSGLLRFSNDRLKRLLEIVVHLAAAQRVRDADKSADGRENCQHDERHRHRPGRLVRLERAMTAVRVVAASGMNRYLLVMLIVNFIHVLTGFVMRTITSRGK